MGDVLIVALNSDRSVRNLKGQGRPIYNQGERAEIVAALEAVDFVIIFHQREPSAVLAALQPHIHVKGRGYQPAQLPECPIVTASGGRIAIVEAQGDYSTTGIINRLKIPL